MRSELNASRMHPLLYCRYLFKLAFYHEIRRTTEEALTFYKHCYSRLTSDAISITNANLSQIQHFATLVNFKMIKIYLTVAPYYQRDYGLKESEYNIHHVSLTLAHNTIYMFVLSNCTNIWNSGRTIEDPLN